MVWTAPSVWRNCMERSDIFSTVPSVPPTTMYSRRETRRHQEEQPDTISFTRVCGAKADRESYDAGARQQRRDVDADLAQRSSAVITMIVACRVMRSNGSTVASRETAAAPPSASRHATAPPRCFRWKCGC